MSGGRSGAMSGSRADSAGAGERGRVVIFGGAGFIGSHLAEDLVDAGYPVRVFDKTHCDWGNLSAIADRIECVEGDFQNRVDVRGALAGSRTAIHLVSSTLPSTSNDNPVYDVEANVVSTLRLLDEARAHAVERILFISSGGTIYGRAVQIPIPEDHPTEPLCSYGVGKLAIEKFLGLYQHLHGLHYHVLRFANPYGERQNPVGAQGAVAVFMGRALKRQPIEIWGTGDVVRDYIYIRDAVRAFRLVLEQNPRERVFNVGTGTGTSINALVEAIRNVTGRAIEVTRKPGRPIDVPENVLDPKRLRDATGWSARTPLAEGLKRTWEWMKSTLPADGAGPAPDRESERGASS